MGTMTLMLLKTYNGQLEKLWEGKLVDIKEERSCDKKDKGVTQGKWWHQKKNLQ